MPIASPTGLSRFFDLNAERRRLLLIAVATLSATSLAVAFLPFRFAIRIGSAALGSGRADPADIAWAVDAAARRMPWRTVCLQKGLAAQRLARRAGHDARLHYGIGKADTTAELEAHVWVMIGHQPLIGGEEAPRFARVAVYP